MVQATALNTAAGQGRNGGKSKLLGLELIRFTCAIAVLVWHYHHFATVGDGAGMLRPHEPLQWLLAPFYRFGLFGVQVFWCISGFIFYWKYADALAARRVEPKRFFWLRFSRLYPLHFATLLLVAALQPIYIGLTGQSFMFADNGLVNFVLQLGLADQWAGPRPMSFNGPIWSVSAEVFVYVAFFLLLRGFGKSPWIIVGAIAASLASLWSHAISPAVICAGYFFAGGAAAQWLASDQKRGCGSRGRVIAAAMVAACAAFAMAVNLAAKEELLTSWLMLVVPPVLYLAAQDIPALNRWQTPIQAAGNVTYSTYLIHFPMQLIVAIIAVAAGINLPVDAAWFLLAYLAATMVLGRVVFVRFEAPVQDMIRAATLSPKGKRAAV